MAGLYSRVLVCLLGLASSGCGVLFGDPIRLFPEKLGLDGGVADPSTACLETAQRISGDAAAIVGSASADDYAALVDGQHIDDIIWPGATPSSIVTVELANARVYSVMSRINPTYANVHTADLCADHVRIDADVVVKTSDGQLNESAQSVSFTAFEPEEAAAEFSVAKGQLQGTYAPRALGQNCYVETSFRLLATQVGVSGAMIDGFRPTCEDADAGVITQQAGGHWGTRWEH